MDYIGAMKINVKRIRQEMEAQGLSVYDLSLLMKRRDQWLYQVFKGKGGRTFKTVDLFAKTLKIPAEELIIQ